MSEKTQLLKNKEAHGTSISGLRVGIDMDMKPVAIRGGGLFLGLLFTLCELLNIKQLQKNVFDAQLYAALSAFVVFFSKIIKPTLWSYHAVLQFFM